MQLPSPNASSEVYLDHTDNFEGASEAWADAEILVAAQTQAVSAANALVVAAADKLRTAAGASDTASRAATKARARYNVRDVILDLRVMSVSDALLNGLCGRSYSHATYRHVFQNGTAGEITGAKVREEPEVVQAMLGRYNSVDDFAGKVAAGDQLGAALQKSLANRDALDAAEKAENGAGDAELLARIGVRNALEQAYGTLRAAFPGQRSFVESFFLKRDRSSAKSDGKEGGSAPPAPATPPNP